jgi:hypothetical protein
LQVFDPHQKSTGTGYTSTVALLTVAFIFVPGAVFLARPASLISISLAVICSALCVVFARASWKNSSQLTMPSILSRPESAK